MDAVQISGLIAAACSGDNVSREKVLAMHRPFIQRQASKVAGRFLDWHNDDELSVALMAFDEALTRFDSGRGAFLAFAGKVIRNRLLDYYRKEQRHQGTVPLEQAADEDDQLSYPAEVHEAWARYDAEQERRRTAEEITLFAAELKTYGITLNDLADASPKHRDTRETLLRIVRTLLTHPDLLDRFKRSRQLPIKELQLAANVSRKVLETGRRYIVAVTVVMLNAELSRIRNYIQIPELKEVFPS